tara:strand:+ start:4770 stop:5408 length:639 start_codon:yes stop_codon:yes gene_type:complete
MIAEKLPKKISVFPLSNAIFFPKTILPLNIFEKRYISLVSDCMKNNKLFGMTQPIEKSIPKPQVYKIGCLGKITSFAETNDKRFIINLSGVIRFKIIKELTTDKLYREFEVDYSDFFEDLAFQEKDIKKHNIYNLLQKVKSLFDRNNYYINFEELEKLNFDQLISTICMISPFSVEEKQKLIEAISIEDKIETLDKIINLNLLENLDTKIVN